jgi:hypothetical protein
MVSVSRNLNCSLVLSSVIQGQYISHVYYGYTVREARRLFAQYVRDYLSHFIRGAQ